MSLFASSSNTSSHTPTRSLRAPIKPSPLTAPPHNVQKQQPTPASHGITAGGTGTNPVADSSPQIPSSTSNLALFLTNLRLLDFDLEPEWPEITAATFSARDAAGGQKKRIQAVEWSLYQLFVLWDPSEAQNKLRPFFPPNDQVQSVNLRAALTRCLEQLKRNGSLGRDAIIRKTMLDECKGDRLEEVLAVFSSAVLKKLVAERALNSGGGRRGRGPIEYHPTISERIAVENRGYTGERTELNGLILAHKVSLTRSLARKNEERARYRDFEELLTLKERSLARRLDQIEASSSVREDSSPEVDDKTRNKVRTMLKTNWTGNDLWVDALLYGGSDARTDSLLDAPFDEVWDGVKQGHLSDIEDQGSDLLGQLDQRVRMQKSRLEKWETFHQKMFGAQKAAPVTPTKKQDRSRRIIEFRSHKDVHLTAGRLERLVPSKTEEDLPAEYDLIMTEMEQELGQVGRPKIPNFAKMFGSTAARLGAAAALAAPEPTVHDPVSDMSEWEEEPQPSPEPVAQPEEPIISQPSRYVKPEQPAVIQPPRYVEPEEPAALQPSRYVKPESSAPRLPSTRSIAPREESRPSGRPRSLSPMDGAKPGFVRQIVASYQEERVPQSRRARQPTRQQQPLDKLCKSPSNGSYQDEPSPMEPELLLPPTSPQPPASPTQAAADEILAYMSNASPSPSKRKPRHTLSLAERTRMSMTRMHSFDADDSFEGGRLSPSKPGFQPVIHEEGPDGEDLTMMTPNGAGAGAGNPIGTPSSSSYASDLVARTQKSMAGFEAARQKAQLERRRSQAKERRQSRMLNTPQQKRESYFSRLGEEEDGDETGEGDHSAGGGIIGSGSVGIDPIGAGDISVIDELLEQPGADQDYEAVFRSRPKIKTSPAATPVKMRWDDGEEGE